MPFQRSECELGTDCLQQLLAKAEARADRAEKALSSMTKGVHLLSKELKHTNVSDVVSTANDGRAIRSCNDDANILTTSEGTAPDQVDTAGSDSDSAFGACAVPVSPDMEISELNGHLGAEQVSAMLELHNATKMVRDRAVLVAEDAEHATANIVKIQQKYVRSQQRLRRREDACRSLANKSAELRSALEQLLIEKRLLVAEVLSLRTENKTIASRTLDDLVGGALTAHESRLRKSPSPTEETVAQRSTDAEEQQTEGKQANESRPLTGSETPEGEGSTHGCSDEIVANNGGGTSFPDLKGSPKTSKNSCCKTNSPASTAEDTVLLSFDADSQLTRDGEWIGPLRDRLPTDFSIRCEGGSMTSDLDSPALTPAGPMTDASTEYVHLSCEAQMVSSLSIPLPSGTET